MKPADCPKWEGCACPICPLDDDWQRRRHLPGERVCLWLRELAKPAGEATVAGALGEHGAQVVAERAPAIMAGSSDIRHKVRQASGQGSKLASGCTLQRSAREGEPG